MSEVHQTLCISFYIDFSISDTNSEYTKGMEIETRRAHCDLELPRSNVKPSNTFLTLLHFQVSLQVANNDPPVHVTIHQLLGFYNKWRHLHVQ